MDRIRKIEKLITEEPDVINETGGYDICPKCGGLFAVVEDEECMCINKHCQNYNTEYDNTLELLNGITPLFLEQPGKLLTSRGTTIPFIALKDMGRYYVVYIPSPHITLSRGKGSPKHTEFTTIEKVWPLIRVAGANYELNNAVNALREYEQHLIELNAPGHLVQRTRERIAELSKKGPYAFAFGGIKYRHRAKIITINRRNVEKITRQ